MRLSPNKTVERNGGRPLLFVALFTCSCSLLIAAAAHLVVELNRFAESDES
jgi:hypothetical protein